MSQTTKMIMAAVSFLLVTDKCLTAQTTKTNQDKETDFVDETLDERGAEVRSNLSDIATKLLFCSDNGCGDQNGSCGRFHFFSVCREINRDLCRGFCSCCLPCTGSCGSEASGTCKGSCDSDEEVIEGDCDGDNCKCCRKREECSTDGTCKSSCNSNTEDEDATVTCNTTGYVCCVPKEGCTARCGLNYWNSCKLSSECAIFNWRPGSCPSGCQCCGSIFG